MMFRVCVALLRAIAHAVPLDDRDEWRREWEAELHATWRRMAERNRFDRREQMNLLRRTLGSVHDAAWLRRQFTRDAELFLDVRHGFRMLGRKRSFAWLAIAVLGLGIGATVGIFSVVDVLLLRPLPYRDADRIVTIWQGSPQNLAQRDDVAPANFLDWREEARGFDIIAAAEPSSFDYTGDHEPEVMLAVNVTEGFFECFGVQPMLGRAFRPEEHTRGKHNVVVLAYGTWQQRFGGDPTIVGRTLSLNRQSYTVIGVLPPSFQPRLMNTNRARGVYAPKVFQGWEQRVRGSGYWNVVARLKPGVTLEQSQAELDAISGRLAGQYPRTNAEVMARAVPLREHLVGGLGPALGVLFTAAGLLLFIASANVASLILARGLERGRELAVRAALGAARPRLVRQLLAESLLLAGLGSAAGLAVAYWTIRLIVALSPADVPRLAEVALDARILGFAALLTGSVAVVVGIVPALQQSRTRLLDVTRGSTTGDAAGPARQGVGSALVVVEVALALLLMTSAGLLLRSFATLLDTDPGFQPERVVALQLFLNGRAYQGDKIAQFAERVVDGMKTVPRVEHVGAVSAMPFIEANMNIETPLTVEGRPAPAENEQGGAFMTITTPEYFQAMKIPVRQGRGFTADDRKDTQPVAIVSETLARRLWADTDPVGSYVRYRFEGQAGRAQVIGIVGDVRHDGLDRPTRLEIFVPLAQRPFGAMVFVARTSGSPGAMTNALKAKIYAVDPQQAVYRVATADELVSKSLVERRFTLWLLSAFAALAMALATVGIYGVMSLTTTQRTKEIGLRVALGAQRTQILAMVVRQGLVLTVGGVVLGLSGAVVFGRVLQSFLYGISATDPLTLASGALLLSIVALAACIIPARRAMRVDPLLALHAD